MMDNLNAKGNLLILWSRLVGTGFSIAWMLIATGDLCQSARLEINMLSSLICKKDEATAGACTKILHTFYSEVVYCKVCKKTLEWVITQQVDFCHNLVP